MLKLSLLYNKGNNIYSTILIDYINVTARL